MEGVIAVWTGGARREVFTIDEARALCDRADKALTARSDMRDAGMFIDDGGAARPLIVARAWAFAFVAAVRRELRRHDAVQAVKTAAPRCRPLDYVGLPDTFIAEPIAQRRKSLVKTVPDDWTRTSAIREAVGLAGGGAVLVTIAGVVFTAEEAEALLAEAEVAVP